MLLVVDDAWKSEDVEPFQVGGSNCRVLVTTREAPVRGAIRYDLDMMSPAEAISAIAPHLPETLLPEALEAARAIQDEYRRAEAISAIAPHLPETLLPEALEAARAMQDEYHRAQAISGIAPHLPETLLPKAFEAARAMQDENNRAFVLSDITPHLPETLLPEALEVIWAMQDEYHRAWAFSSLLLNLKPSYFDFSFWKKSLNVLTYRTRQDLLKDISALSPVIIALGGKEALVATARAIQEVGQQWN